MSYRLLPLLLFVFFPLNAHASDPFVGEWMMDPEMCEDTRFFWSADGFHGVLSFEDGRWEELASAPYLWEGDVMTYTYVPLVMGGSGAEEPVTERVRITMQGDDRLTLENLGREPPDNTADFVRCSPR